MTPLLYFFLRLALWLVVLVSAILTVVFAFMESWNEFIPALILAAAFWTLTGLKIMQRNRPELNPLREETRSSAPGGEEKVVDDEHPPDAATERAVTMRAYRTVFAILGNLALTSFLLAATFFGWTFAEIMMVVIFAAMLAFGAPAWLALVQEEEEDELEQHHYRSRAIR